MNCPRCGGQTRVTQTYAGAQLDNDHNRYLLRKARRAFGFWSPDDFRVRERVCKGCDARVSTIEVEIADFDDALQSASDAPTPTVTFGQVVAAARAR